MDGTKKRQPPKGLPSSIGRDEDQYPNISSCETVRIGPSVLR